MKPDLRFGIVQVEENEADHGIGILIEDKGDISFCSGTAYGLIVGLVVGLIGRKIKESQVKMGLKNRALDNFPDSAQPKMTSSGVVSDSNRAGVNLVLWSIAMLIVVGLAAAGAYAIAF